MMVFTIQVGVIFSYISNPTNHDFYIHKVLMPVNLTQIIDIYIYFFFLIGKKNYIKKTTVCMNEKLLT